MRAARPAAVFDAEDFQRQRRGAGGNNAILADNAVLLAAADKFARQQQQRPLAVIDQHKLIDGGARGRREVHWAAISAADKPLRSLLVHDHFAGGKSLLKRKEGARVLAIRADYGENRYVFVGNGIEQPPFPFWPR